MRFIVCGSRDWPDNEAIRRCIEELAQTCPGAVIMHGDAPGADRAAAKAAQSAGLMVEAYPADWQQHGKAAGVLRNSKMLAIGLSRGAPLSVLAFHRNNSPGTADMIARARRAHVPVVVYAWEPKP